MQLFIFLIFLIAPAVASPHALDGLWLDVMLPVTFITYVLACFLLYRALTPTLKPIATPWMVCFSIIVIPVYVWPGFAMLTNSRKDIAWVIYSAVGIENGTFYGFIYPWGLPLLCWIAICLTRYFKRMH
jgi:hypothetical protein